MYPLRYYLIPSCSNSSIRSISSKQKLKGYVFPEINKQDVDMDIISGWGPGGSNVNASRNCVMLR